MSASVFEYAWLFAMCFLLSKQSQDWFLLLRVNTNAPLQLVLDCTLRVATLFTALSFELWVTLLESSAV